MPGRIGQLGLVSPGLMWLFLQFVFALTECFFNQRSCKHENSCSSSTSRASWFMVWNCYTLTHTVHMSVHVSVSEGESEDQAITPTPQKTTAEKVWFKLAGCRLQVAVNWLKSSNVLDIIAELNTNSPTHSGHQKGNLLFCGARAGLQSDICGVFLGGWTSKINI